MNTFYIFETNDEIITLDLDTEDIVEWQCYSPGFDRWVKIELTDTLKDSPHYKDMKERAMEARASELEYSEGEAIYDYYKEAGDL